MVLNIYYEEKLFSVLVSVKNSAGCCGFNVKSWALCPVLYGLCRSLADVGNSPC